MDEDPISRLETDRTVEHLVSDDVIHHQANRGGRIDAFRDGDQLVAG
jgi:hypothetical protein